MTKSLLHDLTNKVNIKYFLSGMAALQVKQKLYSVLNILRIWTCDWKYIIYIIIKEKRKSVLFHLNVTEFVILCIYRLIELESWASHCAKCDSWVSPPKSQREKRLQIRFVVFIWYEEQKNRSYCLEKISFQQNSSCKMYFQFTCSLGKLKNIFQKKKQYKDV